MKNIKFPTLCLAMTVFISCSLKAQKRADVFTGKWTRNNELSNAGEHISINSIPAMIEAKQNDERLIVVYTSRNSKEETSISNDTLKLDGSISQRTTTSGLQKATILQWTADKKGFTVRSEYKDAQGTVQRSAIESWSINAEGKLQVLNDFSYNGSTLHFIEVFDHQ